MDTELGDPAPKRRLLRWPWSRKAERQLHPYAERYLVHDWPSSLGDEAVSPPRKRYTRWWWVSRGAAAFVGLFVLLVAWLAVTAPLSKSLQPIAPPEITLLAADGTPIARNGAIVDKPVDVKRLPDYVPEAFIAIEDRRFYHHWGVDPRGMARAAWSTLIGHRTEGGSTITQQLAKFTFLTPEQSLGRKAREMLIAFWLEAWLTKDQILDRYLSNAYFGDNCYGLRAASIHYFDRQPENLRPAQAAMLAGLMQAPSRYAPTNNYKLAAERMRTVLQAMVDTGYLTQARAHAMKAPRVDVRDGGDDLPTGTYFADWALPEARKLSDVGYARQTITTTLDSRLQAAARNAIAHAPLGKAQVALVAMRADGEVVAMVGGKDYEKSPFNRATQAQRQPGSTFKLFVYLTALEDGMSPDDRVDNRPFTVGAYRPSNAGNVYSDSITLKDAFARSSNVAAVRVFNRVGSDAVIRTARDLGVTSPLARGDPSLALGTSTMNLLELTAAYAGVAGNEFPVEPHAFKPDAPGWFDWLWNRKHHLSSRVHGEMEELLRAVVQSGTGRTANLGIANYGKTGTSQDNRDALFVGYAGDLVVGVWVGNDDNSPLDGNHGGGVPARIWRDFMRRALGFRTAPPAPHPTPSPNPSGPVQPLDVPDLRDIPLGDGGQLSIDNGGATISTQIDGKPVDVRIDQKAINQDVGVIVDRVRALGQQLPQRTPQNPAPTDRPSPPPPASDAGP